MCLQAECWSYIACQNVPTAGNSIPYFPSHRTLHFCDSRGWDCLRREQPVVQNPFRTVSNSPLWLVCVRVSVCVRASESERRRSEGEGVVVANAYVVRVRARQSKKDKRGLSFQLRAGPAMSVIGVTKQNGRFSYVCCPMGATGPAVTMVTGLCPGRLWWVDRCVIVGALCKHVRQRQE